MSMLEIPSFSRALLKDSGLFLGPLERSCNKVISFCVEFLNMVQ